MRQQPDFRSTPGPGRSHMWDRVALAVALLAALLAAGVALQTRREAEQAGRRLALVRRELVQQQERARSLAERREGRARLAADASSAPLRIVARLGELLPAEARLEKLSIDYERGLSLELLVETRDAASWDRLLERMEGAPELADVEPGPETREAEVRSSVRARWRGGR